MYVALTGLPVGYSVIVALTSLIFCEWTRHPIEQEHIHAVKCGALLNM